MSAPDSVYQLVEKFDRDRERFTQPHYNEAQLRQEFVNPLFAALGWQIGDSRQVLHEAGIRSGGRTKHPDYSFLAAQRRAFYVETKKPAVDIRNSVAPAIQIRSYGWSGNTEIGILTNFREFAVYDCRIEPAGGDLPGTARQLYLTYEEYLDEWEENLGLFARESVLERRHRQVLEDKPAGVLGVDEAFLRQLEAWREDLAAHIFKQAKFLDITLDARRLNELVTRTINRIVFLRIAEDRKLEPPGSLEIATRARRNIYDKLKSQFRAADRRYNSGLFHFDPSATQRGEADTLALDIHINDDVITHIIEDLYPPKSLYEFSVISADILGQVYERFLGKVIEVASADQVAVEEKPEVRKAGGVYYTPAYIVDYIVENTVGKLLEGKSPEEAARLRVLDPACGSGSFLVGAYQFLLDWHLEVYREKPQRYKNRILHSAEGILLKTGEKKRILLNSIYGVDLDPNAVEVSKLSLLLKMLEGENEAARREAALEDAGEQILPDLGGNIKCGNSLIGSDFYAGADLSQVDKEELYRINPFDWEFRAGFGEIMRSGGFDAVIGNPPYVRIQTMKETAPETVPYYKKNYVSASKGNYDIYVVFVEKGLQLLNSEGLLGFILPHKFFNAKYGEPLRGLIADGKNLSKIVHFGDQQVFDGATTYTCLMFLSNHARNDFTVNMVENLDDWQNSRTHIAGTVPSMRATYSDWNFVVGHDSDLFYKLHDMPVKLSDIADRVFQGLVTGADNVFILQVQDDGYYSIATQSHHQLENELLHPLCKGSLNLRRYRVEDVTRSILFPYKIVDEKAVLLSVDEMQQRYPKTWNYLLRNRSALESRERGKWKHDKWYAFGRSQNLNEMEQTKLLTPSIANRASFTLDAKDHFYFVGSGGGGGGGYGITLRSDCKLSYKYVLGLLNSKTLDFVLKKISSRFRGGYFAYNRQYIAQLPIRKIDFDNPEDVEMHDEMVKLVDEMLDLQRQLAGASLARGVVEALIERVDRRIDELVYRLYGLSGAEVGVVGGG